MMMLFVFIGIMVVMVFFVFTGFMVVMVFLMFVGIMIMVMGVIAIYVGNIFEEVKGRPSYLVGERLNFNDD